jgi:hypothetical protein
MNQLHQARGDLMWDCVTAGAQTSAITYATYSCFFPTQTIVQACRGALISMISTSLIGIGTYQTLIGNELQAAAAFGSGTLITVIGETLANPVTANGIFLATVAGIAAVSNHVFLTARAYQEA